MNHHAHVKSTFRLRSQTVRGRANLRNVLIALIATLGCVVAQNNVYYQERYRPQFHFSPEENWMNDPNGMVYYGGEFHLFYQYNPFGDKWGHMSWGHATSSDLVNWQHLPLALAEENNIMIFSGSAVVDWNNSSGFGKDGKPPMIAIYTGHHTNKPLQDQRIAFSNDRGRTWTKYAGNPVIDIGEKDFRDPKVFWHEQTRQWIMAVTWSIKRRVRFYGSPDLKQWTHLSDFGPAGSVNGIWECPDLFPLPVEGSDEQKWVLIVNVGGGAPAGGSGCQYMVGKFDGKTFVLHEPSQPQPTPAIVPDGVLFADFEDGYGDWKTEGDAFGSAPAKGTLNGQQKVDGFLGSGLVNSFLGGDQAVGKLTSPSFEIAHSYINFLIGGGTHDTNTCINLIADGAVVRTAVGNANERLEWKNWDVRELKGTKASIEIVDRWKDGWGHINIDHILFADKPTQPATEGALWADYGRDFYAAVSWSDVPKSDNRRIWLGWMSNWQYAQDVPTSPWRSSMTVPRTLSLRKVGDGYRLLQKPVRELNTIREGTKLADNVSLPQASNHLNDLKAELLDVKLTIAGNQSLTLSFFKNNKERAAQIRIDSMAGELVFDRSTIGNSEFHRQFAGIHRAPLRAVNGKVSLRILLDTSSVEIFANDGESVISDKIFPDSGPWQFEIAGDRAATLELLETSRLKAAQFAPSPTE